MSVQIRELSYALGAEVSGIDITRPIDPPTFARVRQALLDHCVLLFRGQPVTRAQHLAFSRQFGELDNNDETPRSRDPQCHEILLVVNKPQPDGGKVRYTGEVWHSDRSYSCQPALGSLLRAVEIPAVGGDTMFANMYLAYETLSDGMKKLLEGLHGVHLPGSAKIDDSTPERSRETRRRWPPIAQPIVRTHPETGRKALYIGEKVALIAGMTAEESRPLIRYLCAHASRPQFVYRHRWLKDDIVMWDNRCTNHIALGDFDRCQARHMERATVNGSRCGYVYDGALQ